MTYQKVYSVEDLGKVESSIIYIDWSRNLDPKEIIEILNHKNSIKYCIHRLNATICAIWDKLWSDFKDSIEHLFVFEDDNEIKREERFEISTFLGKHSRPKLTQNKELRELYSYWSYKVLFSSDGLEERHFNLIQEEVKLVKVLTDFNLDNVWFLYLQSISNGPISGDADFPVVAKSISIKSYLPRLTKFLRSIKRNKNQVGFQAELNIKSFPSVLEQNPRSWRKVLITGWYGTETAGDKAILGEIIHQLRSYNPQLEILISSIDLRVSWQTRIEMDLDVKHILIQEMHTALEDPNLDAVIMGGGPLMESSQILPIAKLFHGAALKGINRVIFGCGVGPIHTAPMSEQIAHIIKVSNVAFYRDQESLDYAIRLGGDKTNSKLACDPATAFINRWREAHPKREDLKRISTMLREQTAEYETKADIESQNLVFPSRIAEVLVDLKKNSSSLEELNLIPMHVYWRGNDDRFLNHKIASKVEDHLSLSPYLGYKGIYELVDSLSQSKLAIAMRYHGHIFSIALNIPFISLDYTGKKGKVSNLMQRLGLKDYSVKFEDFTPSVLKLKLEQIEANPEIETDLKAKTQELTATLEKAYQFFWN